MPLFTSPIIQPQKKCKIARVCSLSLFVWQTMGNTIKGIIAFIPSKTCQNYLLGELEEMPVDKMVDLSSKQLRRFPLRVCAFKELVKLYLSDNNLNTLPPELELLQNLQILALDFNHFKVLPQVVCALKQLSILYLGNNRLRDLPPELCFLKNLQTLWIESNYFTHLPVVVCELTLLKTLHAGSNPIRQLPTELKNLKELRSIWMSGTLLTDFPPVLLEMPFLDVIDVDRNGIRFFPNLVHMQSLKLVIYDHNPCRNAPKVAKGVRRVGRWSEETPEPIKRSEAEAELEKTMDNKEAQALPPKDTSQSNENPTEATTVPI
ncbi:hypothetical protein XELAEV_18021173mg [Xenopus laevis]|uniref:Leucine-rich repeat-containing protein 10 n=1 Tax=Xenopus laevis TaxID=8355 RepID=A0A974D8P4_XENLA|nr:hypothetical protein XELAEV_18021173mg [Xenopus laevis]